MGQNLTQDWMEERQRGFKTLYLALFIYCAMICELFGIVVYCG